MQIDTSWAHGANHRDSSIHLGSAPTRYYYASKKLLKSWALCFASCAQLYEIDPRSTEVFWKNCFNCFELNCSCDLVSPCKSLWPKTLYIVIFLVCADIALKTNFCCEYILRFFYDFQFDSCLFGFYLKLYVCYRSVHFIENILILFWYSTVSFWTSQKQGEHFSVFYILRIHIWFTLNKYLNTFFTLANKLASVFKVL